MLSRIERHSGRILFVFFAAVFAVICGLIVSAKFLRDPSPFILNGSETFTVVSLDEGASFEMIWAYSVDVKESDRLVMDNYGHGIDLSFKRFSLTGSWDESSEGYPRTESVGDALTFEYPFVNREIGRAHV